MSEFSHNIAKNYIVVQLREAMVFTMIENIVLQHTSRDTYLYAWYDTLCHFYTLKESCCVHKSTCIFEIPILCGE